MFTACTATQGKVKDENGGVVSEVTKTPIEVMTVGSSDMTNSVLLSGKIASARDVYVSPMIQGKVLSVNVREGDIVKKGDVLFTIDKKDVERQYNDMKANLDDTKLLNEKTLEIERKNIEDLKALYEVGGIAKSDLEKAELGFLSKEIQINSSLQSVETQLQNLEDTLANVAVTSPINGVVTAMNVIEGTIAQATSQQPLLAVSETNSPEVSIGISETLLPYIKSGDTVKITVPAVSTEGFDAKVRSVSTTTDVQTGLYTVTVTLPTDESYSIGMFVNAEFITEEQKAVVSVPQSAVLTDQESKYVYVVENEKARKVPVTTGLTNGTNTEITSGLNGGEILVIKGSEYLTNDSFVEIVGGN